MLGTVILVPLILISLYTNCQQVEEAPGGAETSSQSSGGYIAEKCAPTNMAPLNPKTIDSLVDLVNQLPRPLSLNCFLKSLAKPFKVFATKNTGNAQPAFNADSPRILIIGDNFVFSVVPGGPGKDLLEVSQVFPDGTSVKGEILFPVLQPVPVTAPYDRLLLNSAGSGTGTFCQICHTNETRVLIAGLHRGDAYVSDVLRPDSSKRVSATRLQYLAGICGSDDQVRCNILKTIFIEGSAQDVAFPF